MLGTSKTFEKIEGGKGISKCGFVLPNQCQCWRAGEYRVSEVVPAPTEKDPKATRTLTYQLCARHSHITQKQDEEYKKQQEKEKTPEPPKPAPSVPTATGTTPAITTTPSTPVPASTSNPSSNQEPAKK